VLAPRSVFATQLVLEPAVEIISEHLWAETALFTPERDFYDGGRLWLKTRDGTDKDLQSALSQLFCIEG